MSVWAPAALIDPCRPSAKWQTKLGGGGGGLVMLWRIQQLRTHLYLKDKRRLTIWHAFSRWPGKVWWHTTWCLFLFAFVVIWNLVSAWKKTRLKATITSTHDSRGSRTVGSWFCDRAACWSARGCRCRAEWHLWWGHSPQTQSPSATAGWTGSSGRPAEPWPRSLESWVGSSLYTTTNLREGGNRGGATVTETILLRDVEMKEHVRMTEGQGGK